MRPQQHRGQGVLGNLIDHALGDVQPAREELTHVLIAMALHLLEIADMESVGKRFRRWKELEDEPIDLAPVEHGVGIANLIGVLRVSWLAKVARVARDGR